MTGEVRVASQSPGLWKVLAAAALGVTLLAGFAVSLRIGDVAIDGSTICASLFHFDPESVPHVLIRDGRLPRTVADLLAGAALAVAGAIMQTVTRNPLASPGIMGLNAGAGFGIVMAIVLIPGLGRSDLMAVSIGGAVLGAALVFGLASLSRGGVTPIRLALTGVATSALLGAIGNGMMIANELGQDLLLWQARGTEGVRWIDIAVFSPMAAVGMLGAVLLTPSLNVLALGDQVAVGLGQRTVRARFLAGTVVLTLAGGAVAMTGPVGFVGLMVPHLVRSVVGLDCRTVIPGSALGGALLLLAADVTARVASTPFRASVPVGVVTSLIGVPFFLYLASRRPIATHVRGIPQ